MVIGGGLGPLPTEAQLLEEFVPEERLLNRCEAVIRVFNQYGNRANKNKARMKFILRERGIAWLKEHIEKEYADILANGGIAWPDSVPEGFGGYQSKPWTRATSPAPSCAAWRGSLPPPATDWCASPSSRTCCWRSSRWAGCRACMRRCAIWVWRSRARGRSKTWSPARARTRVTWD